MRNVWKDSCKKILPFLLLALLSLFFCWFFVGRHGIFGSKVDWISQHSVIPDYFRQQFYETGELFPEFAANIGGGQNIYNFSYYGLSSPVILLSYLFPSVKMGDYMMAASIVCLAAAVLLFYGWLLKRGFSGKISFMVSLMYLLSGPMIFHSYSQIMFVNYMPFLCMAFLGVDSYFEKGRKLLYTVSVFLMIMTSFYFSIGGMLALVLYGLYRYFGDDVKEAEERKGFCCGKYGDTGIKNIASYVNKKKYDCEFSADNIACDINLYEKNTEINIACNPIIGFLMDGVRFLWPMLTAVLMSGILLIPTAAALAGRSGRKEAVSAASLLVPDMQVDRLLYTPYGIGLTTFLITVLITGFTYKTVHERILSWGCTAVLVIPFFTWVLNGGLYIREKALIPFLPVFCYLIACYVKKLEERRISSIKGCLPFLMNIGLFCAGQRSSAFPEYRILFLIDAVIMAGCYLLFCWKRKSMFILMPPVLFLILFGTVFHEQADRIESREFYDKVTDQEIGQEIEEILEEEPGFYRLEQVGNEEENAADLNRIWSMGQYISSIYSSSYNQEYQDFRKEVFGVEEPFRNSLMQSVSQNPVFLKLMGVRYLAAEKEVLGYEPVNQGAGGLRPILYENQDAAPIAYVTDQMISERAYADLEFPYHQMALACGAVREGEAGEKKTDDVGKTENVEIGTRNAEAIEKHILEEVRQALEPVEIVLPEQESESLRIVGKEDGYRIQAKKKTAIQAVIHGYEDEEMEETDRILFLRFHVNNKKPGQDVSVWLEGERNKLSARNHIYYNGNTTFSFAVMLEKGKNAVELKLGKGEYELTEIECFSGDWGKQVNQERSARLYQTEFHMDQEKTRGNVIAGSVDVEKEGYFVTSIPYDPNFEILEDGKRVEYEKVNTAFLGFPIREGRHFVEIIYHAPGRKTGAWCSMIGAGMLLAVIVCGRLRRGL